MSDGGKIKAKSGIGVALTLVAGASLALAAAPAASASPSSDCYKYACIWRDENFGSNSSTNTFVIGWNVRIPELRDFNYTNGNGNTLFTGQYPANGHDSADSGINKGSWDQIRIFEHENKGGLYSVIRPGYNDAVFGNTVGEVRSWHDRADSVYFESEL